MTVYCNKVLHQERNIKELKVGDYLPFVQSKGKVESFITPKLKDGTVFWTVRIDKDGYFDLKEQSDAEILSRLVRIENLLKRKKCRT